MVSAVPNPLPWPVMIYTIATFASSIIYESKCHDWRFYRRIMTLEASRGLGAILRTRTIARQKEPKSHNDQMKSRKALLLLMRSHLVKLGKIENRSALSGSALVGVASASSSTFTRGTLNEIEQLTGPLATPMRCAY